MSEKTQITFFLNCMGPISYKWYEDGNIPFEEETRYSKFLNKEVTVKRFKELWYGGRIDIYGLPEDEFYSGKSEYGVPIMRDKCWNNLSKYLSELKLDHLPTREELFSMFENEYGEIEWWHK